MQLMHAKTLLLAAALSAGPGVFGTLPGWGLPLPRVVPTAPVARAPDVSPLTPTVAIDRRDVPASRHVFVAFARPVAATVILGRFVWHAVPDVLADVVAAGSRALKQDGFTAGSTVTALARAWVALAARPALPYMVGTLSADAQGLSLVIRPLSAAFDGPVLPACASYEGDNGQARRVCGLVASSGGVLRLAGATKDPWVAASITTPLGPRLALTPPVLARGLHIARRMPADARLQLAEDIEVTTRARLIEPADCVAAIVAIDFAGLAGPLAVKAAAG